MAKARTSRKKSAKRTAPAQGRRVKKRVGGHAKAGKRCAKCGKPHSTSAHWSHKVEHRPRWFGQTPKPQGRKTAAGNPSRAVVPGKRRPKGMTKAEARAARAAMTRKKGGTRKGTRKGARKK